jgi:hypothetical protein
MYLDVLYIFRHNVAETYIPNGGEKICSVAHATCRMDDVRVVSRALQQI